MSQQPDKTVFQVLPREISRSDALVTDGNDGRGTEMSSVYADPRWINHRPTAMAEITALTVAGIRNAIHWYRQRRAAQILQRLSDHELKDLGMHRSQIVSVVHSGNVEQSRYRNAND